MSTLPTYVWAMVLAGLIGTTATICAMLFRGALAAGSGRGSAIRLAGGFVIVWSCLGIGEPVLADGRCLSVRADEAGAVAACRIDGCSRSGAAVESDPHGVGYFGPARWAVAIDGAPDLSGGRRDLPGRDGVGKAARRVCATGRTGRYGNRFRGRVRRAQPAARHRRSPRGVVQRPGPRRSPPRPWYRLRRSARSRPVAPRITVHRGDLAASTGSDPCHCGAAGICFAPAVVAEAAGDRADRRSPLGARDDHKPFRTW